MSIDSDVYVSEASASLCDVWPETGRKLAAMLRARRVEAWIADDIIQEVALRVLQAQPAYSNGDDLYPWAATVARNLHVSHIRANRKFRVLESAADVATRGDLETQVEWRLALASVLQRIEALPEPDRRALADGLAERDASLPSGPEPSRVTVRRHRVRRRLRAAAQGVLAVGAWIWSRRTKLAAGASMPAVIAAAAVQILMGVVPTLSGPPDAPSVIRVLSNEQGSAAENSTRGSQLRPHGSDGPATHVRAKAPATETHAIATLERGGRGLRVTSRPARPGEALICLHDIPTVGALCTPFVGATQAPASRPNSARMPVSSSWPSLGSASGRG